MSELSYLENLLNGVEVKWLALENAAELKRGKRLVRSQLELEGEFAVYQNSMTPLGYYHQHNTNPDTTFVICAGAAGEIGYSSSPFWAADDVYYVASTNLLNSKFLYHYLLTQKNKISSQVRKASIPRLSKTSLDRIFVPIPCPNIPEKSLAIQAEIVRILDKFTALTAELTAELNMRKKQYNYYRDKLLSFEEGGVEWKTLGEIVKMRAGQHISARNIVDGKEGDFVYPCFGGNGIRGYVKEKSHDGEHLLIGRQGALCGNVQRMKGQFYATEHAVVVSAMQGIDIDWAFHMLTTMNLNQYASKSAQPGLAVGKLQELKLLVPSIERQKYIAKMLDKFDTLTGSITEGLPREIELRQKQYEYYRDLLFSFPKTETASN
ncbi:restriction endonuclease subunit S [Escherichia coli]